MSESAMMWYDNWMCCVWYVRVCDDVVW